MPHYGESLLSPYTVPKDTDYYNELSFYMSVYWTKTNELTFLSSYNMPIIKADVAIFDIFLVDEEGYVVDAAGHRYDFTDADVKAEIGLKDIEIITDDNVIPACDLDFDSCQQCFSVKDFDDVINRKFNLLSISELNPDTSGVISFIRGNSELLDSVADAGIAVGNNIHYYNNDGNEFAVTIEDENFSLSAEMANNIFIRV